MPTVKITCIVSGYQRTTTLDYLQNKATRHNVDVTVIQENYISKEVMKMYKEGGSDAVMAKYPEFILPEGITWNEIMEWNGARLGGVDPLQAQKDREAKIKEREEAKVKAKEEPKVEETQAKAATPPRKSKSKSKSKAKAKTEEPAPTDVSEETKAYEAQKDALLGNVKSVEMEAVN